MNKVVQSYVFKGYQKAVPVYWGLYGACQLNSDFQPVDWFASLDI